MKIVRFEADRPITRFDSRGAAIGGIARSRGECRLSLVELDEGGVIGLHEALSPQLLLVVRGVARVRGGDEPPVEIAAGEGAFWSAGELHETTTAQGLGAIVVEGELLELL